MFSISVSLNSDREKIQLFLHQAKDNWCWPLVTVLKPDELSLTYWAHRVYEEIEWASDIYKTKKASSPV